jgi:hypothetical protein
MDIVGLAVLLVKERLGESAAHHIHVFFAEVTFNGQTLGMFE